MALKIEAISQIHAKTEVNDLLSRESALADASIQKSVSKSYLFSLNKQRTEEILRQPPGLISFEIKTAANESLTLDLYNENSSFADLIVTTPGQGPFDRSAFRAAFYRGILRGDNKSVVSISIYENEVAGFISSEKGNFVLGKLKTSDKIILYPDNALTQRVPFQCMMQDMPMTPGELSHLNDPANTLLTNNCVRLYFEAEYDIFQNLGSTLNVVQYVTNLYNQSGTLYANDGISTTLSEIRVWDSPDPYTATTPQDLLTQFQAQTNSINGTLGQLLTFRTIGGGIAAGFSGICNPNVDNSLCVSGNLESSFPNVPTYSWSVMVVTHEFGHLFGSRHTHACVWNGNNTAIDGCAGFTEGGCPVPGIPQDGGTIMSYCHLTFAGINFSRGFGPQPTNVITTNVNNANCLGQCCPTSVTISGNYSTPLTQSSTWISSSGQTTIVNSASVKLDPDPVNGYVLLSPVSKFEYFLSAPTSAGVFVAQPLDGCGAGIPTRPGTEIISLQDIVPESVKPRNGYGIYPNPAKEFIIVTSENQLTDALLQLFDLNGKAVKTTITTINGYSKKLAFRGMAPGLYILKISGKKTNHSAKIIIN